MPDPDLALGSLPVTVSGTKLIASIGVAAMLMQSGCMVAAPPAPLAADSAEVGVIYRYELYDHCGLDTVPIEFDGSEWKILGDDGGANPPAGFGNPTDEGTIRLTSVNEGIYRSSGGVERTIVRVGEIQPTPTGYVIPCI